MNLDWLSWVSSLSYVGAVFCIVATSYWGRGSGSVWKLMRVPVELANRVKMKVLGGSHLILCGLFFVILLNNLVGVVPESAKSSAQLFFGLGFALPLWLGFIMSSVFMGCVYISLASMVLKGLPVLGGALLWFVEWSSIIIRWMTLSVRLSANMSVGVVMVSLLNGVLMVLLFGPSPWWVLGLVVLSGAICVSIELFMCCLQAFIFTMLMSVYSDDHCFFLGR